MSWNESRRGNNIAKILNDSSESAQKISDQVVTFVQSDLGENPEEAIPGLMAAIVVFALMTHDPEQALDEAVALLDMPKMGDA